MNIAFFMRPKAEVAYVYDDFTARQALEKLRHHGYTAVPVLNREGEYVGTLSEGDLLWLIVNGEGGEPHTRPVEDLEKFKISNINLKLSGEKNPPVNIMAKIDELLLRVLGSNFIPIVDDRGIFIGIVTRSVVIKYFYENSLSLEDFANEEESK